MTLLSRAIGSSGQGLGYLDKMIEKSELEDQKFEANINQYNTMAGGVKSAATYMGKTSRGILNEYARAFETAIDNFAADPSADNERVIEQIRLQTQDFYNRASATRQNSMANLNAVRENPENYSVSVAKAQQMFSDLEDNDMSARFDLDSMTMYVGDGQSQMQIGDAGYYNGSQPLVYDKAAQLGAIKAEGSWGSSHLDQFMGMVDPNDKKGREKIIEAFMETARPSSSAYQETAIYNYLQDIKGLDLTQIDNETELQERILEVRNDASELTAALRHMGELEYNYMAGAKAAKGIAAANATFNELFRGDVDTRTDISESGEDPYVLTQTGETGAATRYSDPFAGVTGVRMLEKPLTADSGEGGLAGVSDFGDVLVGYDVDALGRIVVEVEKKVVDPDDEENETMIREFHVLDDESGDLYRNLRADLKGKGIFGLLQEQSIARKMYREKSANDRAIAEAYANSDLEPTLPEHRLTTTPEEVRAATGPSLRQTQSERNREQRREEFNEVSTVEKQSVIALAGLPKNIRQSYYSEEDKNSFGNYNIPEGATMKGNNVVVNGEEVGKRVTQRSSETGKYETRGMVPIQKNAIQRFFQGVGRLFGPSDSNVEEYLDAKQKIETEDTPIGPVDNSREILNKAESDRLRGRDFPGDSSVIDSIFEEEGYSADGILVNVPKTENSGVTIGGLDLGSGAGNIEEKLNILQDHIPEDQMEALKPLTKLTGPMAEEALRDSIDSGKLNPDTWGFTDDTFKEIQTAFVEGNTMPSVVKKLKSNGVTEDQINNLPKEVVAAIVSIEFMTPGTEAIKAVAKAIKSGDREDWLEAARQYEVYYGGSASEQRKLEANEIMQGNIDRAKRAASAIRSVYS